MTTTIQTEETKFIRDCKAELRKEVVALTIKLNDFPVTLGESREAAKEWRERLAQDVTFAVSKEGERLYELAQRAFTQDMIDNRLDTINTQLMQCNHVYVVTDTQHLESPAGFHPDSKVFRQTTIAIHTDTLKNLPKSNLPLYSHKVN